MFTAKQIQSAIALINDAETDLKCSFTNGQMSDLLLDNFDWLNSSKESHELLAIISRYSIVHRERTEERYFPHDPSEPEDVQ